MPHVLYIQYIAYVDILYAYTVHTACVHLYLYSRHMLYIVCMQCVVISHSKYSIHNIYLISILCVWCIVYVLNVVYCVYICCMLVSGCVLCALCMLCIVVWYMCVLGDAVCVYIYTHYILDMRTSRLYI